MSLEKYRLGERRLKTLGDDVSRLRSALRNQALKIDEARALEQDKDIL